MTLRHVLAGISVVLALEGIAYAAFPALMARMAAHVAGASPGQLRVGGLVAAIIATGLAWLLVSA